MTDRTNKPEISTYRRSLNAILIVCGGWFCFAMADATTKYLMLDYPLSQILAISNGISFFACLIWLYFGYGGLKAFRSPRWKWHILRGVIMLAIVVLITNALRLIPLAEFYGIIFLAPFMATILAFFLLKEPLDRHKSIAIFGGFFGVLILAGFQYDTLNIGILFCAIGAVLISVNKIIVRKIGHADPMPYYPLFSNFLVFAASLPFAVPRFTMPETGDWLLFLLLAPMVLGGMIGFSRGFSIAPSTAVVAPFHYTQIIWGVLLGWLLFSDIPTMPTIIGISIIILSGLYLVWQEYACHCRQRKG